ncbi:hypothetical protein JYU34_005921 [Plutella xylostella]|uniref:Uncharacterized protein n=1 Tax=Plutella xylostella TaxID=51655 RepID=A0ABQ7QUI8_PLUXY|nr:hypothetical protein JYU34_005921 [Plutella xylostella]
MPPAPLCLLAACALGAALAAPRAAYEEYESSLQRRGQAGAGRGRTMRCYFNAVTCF